MLFGSISMNRIENEICRLRKRCLSVVFVTAVILSEKPKATIAKKEATQCHFLFLAGTEGRNRTGTPLREPDFESGASTSSATPA